MQAQREEKERVVRNKQEVQDCFPEDRSLLSQSELEYYNLLERDGDQEAVRYLYGLALHHLKEQETSEAARVLDCALRRIERSSAGEASAKEARSKFKGEYEKIFKGEPYEQVMVYLLRGLLYMGDGDFENARALFRTGALKDRSSEESAAGEQYNADTAEFDYLEALCNAKLHDAKAEDCYRFAQEHARNAAGLPAPTEDFNALLVFMAGLG
ncbi:MAG: hypothetical protein HYZ36_02450, partial [Pedosphaera parvula]|nr:hypothetical protein [Pedosphaera parvula]